MQWSILGGQASLMHGIARELTDCGLTAVTFDMRGVGGSSGSRTVRGAAEVFERAWGLLPLSLHDDEANEEMKLVKRLRGIFQQSGQEAAAGGRGGGAEL